MKVSFWCSECSNGEYHGFPPVGSPQGSVCTIYFWCPVKEHHNSFNHSCNNYEHGVPKQFDKFGNLIPEDQRYGYREDLQEL